jgi:hypothetical protein
MNEQFPPEIEALRKKLYPVMKEAKKDHKCAKLVRNVLYINGEQYTPPEGSTSRTDSNHKTQAALNDQPSGTTHRPSNLSKRARQVSTPDGK